MENGGANARFSIIFPNTLAYLLQRRQKALSWSKWLNTVCTTGHAAGLSGIMRCRGNNMNVKKGVLTGNF